MTRSVSGTKKAFATLFTIMVLMFVSLLIISGMLISGVSNLESSRLYRDAIIARALANSCAEVAVNRLKLDTNYTGNETVTLSNGQCQILAITNSGGQGRIIRTSASYSTVVRKVEVSLQLVNPVTVVDYWQDKAF